MLAVEGATYYLLAFPSLLYTRCGLLDGSVASVASSETNHEVHDVRPGQPSLQQPVDLV